MSTTIVIADDHAVVREGIRGLLRIDPGFTVLAEAENGETAILMVREHRPDVLLLDLMMPGMGDTAEAMIGIIRKASPDTHIMILTSSDDDRLAFKAIEAGAHSFLLKSMRGEHLLNAIHAAGKGTPTLHPLVAQRLLHSIRNPQTSQFEDLTVRELEVLRCLAEGGSNAKISAQLNITEKTVKAHLGSIMSKLDLTDRTQAVALAWRAGLMKQ